MNSKKNLWNKLGLGIIGASLLVLSGCEVIEGNIRTEGLELIDTKGKSHRLNSGPIRMTVRNKVIVFKDLDDKEKVKIRIPESGFSIPAPNSQVTLQAAATGQKVDIIASTTATNGGGSTSTRVEACDCDGMTCYGQRVVSTHSSSTVYHYDIRFENPSTGAVVGDMTAQEISGGSNTSVGPCINVRPRPMCPPGTVYDRSIGRCVSIVTPPRPRPLPPAPPAPRPIPNPDGRNCPPGTHWDARLQRCVA